jgi:hypothetical protein
MALSGLQWSRANDDAETSNIVAAAGQGLTLQWSRVNNGAKARPIKKGRHADSINGSCKGFLCNLIPLQFAYRSTAN